MLVVLVLSECVSLCSILKWSKCERTFSTLKFVKTRLRSTISQDNLEAFLLMSTHKDTLMDLSIDVIIDKLAETSDLMRRQLTF